MPLRLQRCCPWGNTSQPQGPQHCAIVMCFRWENPYFSFRGNLLPFACDSLFSLQAVVPSSTMQDIYSNIFKVPVWSSGVSLEGSSSHTFPSRLPHMRFWGGRALIMVHLSWSLTMLVGCCRREPLHERVLLPLQVQVACTTARTS